MTDIIFNCPHCTKSLAVDERGAGRKVKCVDCGGVVTVPIPAKRIAMDEAPNISMRKCERCGLNYIGDKHKCPPVAAKRPEPLADIRLSPSRGSLVAQPRLGHPPRPLSTGAQSDTQGASSVGQGMSMSKGVIVIGFLAVLFGGMVYAVYKGWIPFDSSPNQQKTAGRPTTPAQQPTRASGAGGQSESQLYQQIRSTINSIDYFSLTPKAFDDIQETIEQYFALFPNGPHLEDVVRFKKAVRKYYDEAKTIGSDPDQGVARGTTQMILESWRDGTKNWRSFCMNPDAISQLISPQSWEVRRVAKRGEYGIDVIVFVRSSTHGGIPIERNWRFMYTQMVLIKVQEAN